MFASASDDGTVIVWMGSDDEKDNINDTDTHSIALPFDQF